MAVSLSDSPPSSQGPSCPVCFRDYSDNEAELIPRILQCGHTYCTQCLEKLLTTETDEEEFHQVVLNIRYAGREWRTTRRYPSSFAAAHASNELKCPTCSSINHIHNGDVTKLTKNFALLSCRPQLSKSPLQRSKHYCNEHHHEKRVYCNECKVLVCAYCQLYGEHKGHDCIIATEAAQPLVEALKVAEESVLSDLGQISRGEEEVRTAVLRLSKQHRRCVKKVKAHFGRLTSRLADQRAALLTRMDNWSEEQLFILQAQLDSLRNAKKDCEAVVKGCKTLVEGDPIDALMQQEEVIDGVGVLRSRVSGLSFNPLIKPTIKCTLTGNEEEMLSSVLESCKVMYDTEGEEGSGGESSVEEDEEEEEAQSALNMAYHPGLIAACSSDEERKQTNVYSQETQDHTSGFLSGLPRSNPSIFSGRSLSSWTQESFYTPDPIHAHVHLPTGSSAQEQPSTSSANNTFTGGSLFTLDPPSYPPLSQSQASTSSGTTLNFFNPITTKPKNTNLLQRFGFSVTQPVLDESGSNSEEEGSFHVLGHRHRLHFPITAPLMRNASIESPQEETAHSEENLFHPTLLHHAGIFSEEFANGQENLTRKRSLDMMRLRRRYPLEEEEEGEQSLLDEEHEPQNGIMPPMLSGSGANLSDHELPTDSFHFGLPSYRSAHSDPPSPSQQASNDYHLTHDFNSDDEITYPVTQYSWQSDTGNQSVTLEVDHTGGVVQVSIQAQPDTTTAAIRHETSDMELTDLDDAGEPEES